VLVLPPSYQYVSGAQAMNASALMKMEEMVHASDTCEAELLQGLERSFASQQSSSYRKWWVPLLLCMARDGEGEGRISSPSLLTLQSAIEQGQDAYSRFKRCSDVKGLILLLGIEFEELQTARSTAIRSTYPSTCEA
jgi:hypothetical protein